MATVGLHRRQSATFPDENLRGRSLCRLPHIPGVECGELEVKKLLAFTTACHSKVYFWRKAKSQ